MAMLNVLSSTINMTVILGIICCLGFFKHNFLETASVSVFPYKIGGTREVPTQLGPF
jgi:hypothetical protein